MAGPIRNLIRNIRQNRQMRREERQDRPLQLTGRGGLPLFRSLGAGTARLDAQVASRIAQKYPADRPMQANPDGPDTGQYAGNRPDGIVYPTQTTTAGPKPESVRAPAPKQAGSTKALPVSRVPDPNRTAGMAGPSAVSGGVNDLPEPPKKMSPRESLVSQQDAARKALAATQQRLSLGGLAPENLAALQSAAVVANQQLGDFSEQLAAMDEAENGGATKAIRDVEEAARKAVVGQGTWEGLDRLAQGQFAITTDAGVQMPDPHAARRVARPIVEQHAAQLFAQHNGFAGIPVEQRSHLLRGLMYAYPISPKAITDPNAFRDETNRIAMQLNSVNNQENDQRKAAYYTALAEYITLMQKVGYKEQAQVK